ncbi:MAG: GNAT family N-acetyltransferase [Verrucomicrobiae bacterium]|nr:GNAT family N-acetyltransferase [Verrucomicrobiae bacterium]
MLRLKKMVLAEVPDVVPLFLDESQTQYWESGIRHDAESANELLRGYFRVPSYHWMMFSNGEVVGYGHLLRSDYLEAWIVSYIVAPEFQGLGIATAFVEEVKGFALNEGIEILYASAHTANLASIRVIEKSGFQPADALAHSKENLYRWESKRPNKMQHPTV